MTQAQSQVSMCVSSEFCSDECRSIYFKVLWCNNGTADLVRLEYLDLFCAISSDPQHQDSPNCLDFNVKSKTSGAPEYGFLADCLLETTTNLALPCMETCKTELRSYRNECCSINLAVAKQSIPGEDNEDLINLYSDRLWEHCEVNSPQMCPTPTCPTSTVPTATTTMISVPLATAPSELPGASPKHHMNWFILFITVLFILCNI